MKKEILFAMGLSVAGCEVALAQQPKSFDSDQLPAKIHVSQVARLKRCQQEAVGYTRSFFGVVLRRAELQTAFFAPDGVDNYLKISFEGQHCKIEVGASKVHCVDYEGDGRWDELSDTKFTCNALMMDRLLVY